MPVSHFLLRPFKSLKNRYAGHPIRLSLETIKAIFAFHVFSEFAYMVVPVEGPSMLPTFEVMGDHLLISKRHRKGRGIRVGDLVSFDSVAVPGERAVKRVIGLQGDYVMRDTPETGSTEMIQVPQGHCWLVGDNLPYSRDSRMFGPVPLALIKGKIIAKVFPWGERRWIENDVRPVETM